MHHHQHTQNRPVVSPQAGAALPVNTDCYRNASEELSGAFTQFRPLAILTSDVNYAASSVIGDFLDGIGKDVAVARVAAASSNAIAGMREIIRAVGFDPKNMSIGEMGHVFAMFLSYQKAHDRRTIICVEDAPDNKQWVLDRVQQLVKLELERKYGLMVILSGRPGLIESLDEHPLNELAADVGERITIAPFMRGETPGYVRRRSAARDNLDVDQLSERHAITLIRRLRRRVPEAAKKFYVKYLHVAHKERSDAVTSGVAKEAAKQLGQGRMTQHADVPARTMKGNGASPAVGRLIVHIGDEIIQAEVLKRDCILIGRSKMCDLRMASHKVSRHHAMVINSSNGTDLVDMRSTNGTVVDGRPIARHPLQGNDAILIDGCLIRYIAYDDR